MKKIPKGLYCYDKNGNCPYRTCILDDGVVIPFCKYLNEGDASNLNDEDFNTLIIKYGTEDALWEKYQLVILWDWCKECSENWE